MDNKKKQDFMDSSIRFRINKDEQVLFFENCKDRCISTSALLRKWIVEFNRKCANDDKNIGL